MVGTAAATYDNVSLVCLVCLYMYLVSWSGLCKHLCTIQGSLVTSQLSDTRGYSPCLGKREESLTRSRLKVPRLKRNSNAPLIEESLVSLGIIKEWLHLLSIYQTRSGKRPEDNYVRVHTTKTYIDQCASGSLWNYHSHRIVFETTLYVLVRMYCTYIS